MKKLALLTGALCAISSGLFAQQSAVFIPAFQNRFASIHEPVVALNTINPSPSFQVQTFGGTTTSTDPAASGVVTSPTAGAARPALDATTMNIPVFPGNTVFFQQPGALGTINGVTGVPVNSGFGNTGFFIQQGGGSSLVPVDPFRTTATPGPAVNAVPNPAAPVPTIPQLQISPNPTIPVQMQNPTTLTPAVPVIQGGTHSGQALGNSPTPNTPSANTPRR